MEPGWVVVFTTEKEYKAHIAIELLGENNIIGILMNQRDSVYNSFGTIDILVKEGEALQAKQILNSASL